MWLNYTGDRIFVLPGNPFSARLCQIVISVWQQKYKIYTKKHLLLDYLWIFIIPDKICVISQAVQSYVPITKLNCGHFYLYEEHLSDCCPHWLSAALLNWISSLKSLHHVSTFSVILWLWTSWKRHCFFNLFLKEDHCVIPFSSQEVKYSHSVLCYWLFRDPLSFSITTLSPAEAVLKKDWTLRNNYHLLRC